MFPVVLNDGQNEMPKDDIYYVIAKEGVYLKKKLGVMESLAPVKQISTLQSITATATMHIEKIPGPKFAKIIEFFREVYKEYYGEAIVLLFYDEEKKTYFIMPPHQKVSGGSCDYNRGITVDGYTMIGTIHSHAAMSAFHSGVDDKDEEGFDGLHITIGNVRDEEVSISASIVANGHRIMVDPRDYVEQLQLTQDIDEDTTGATTKVYEWKDGKLQENLKKTNRYAYNYRRFDKRYVVTVTDHQKRFNQKWMKVVEKGHYVHKGWNRGVGRGYGADWYTGNGWGYGFDADAWNQMNQGFQRRLPGSFVVHGKPDPRNVGPYKTQGIVFPPHKDEDEDEDVNHCQNCVHRDDKLGWALEQFTEEAEDEPNEEDVIDNFASRDDYDKMFMDGNITCQNCFETYHGPSYQACPTCGAPNISKMKASQDPIAGQRFSCPTCTNEFDHEGEDECPFCHTELDFTEFREAALVEDKSDEEGEPSIGKDIEPGKWYICNLCTTIFEAKSVINDCHCPSCGKYMLEEYNCTQYNIEDERTSIADKDSGKLMEDSKRDILLLAAEADKYLERIPDPQKLETPLSTRVQKTSRMSIKEMFKRTFGKERTK